MRILGFGGNQLAAAGGYEVDNSLRFDDGSSDSLTRTPSSAGNRKTFTLSLWFKRASNFESTNNILWVGNDSNNRTLIQISDVDVIDLQNKSGGSVNAKLSSNAKRRDPSAWYHLVWSVDTTQATSSNRIKVYVNGVQETSFSTETYPSQNTDFFINNNQSHSIGKQNDASAGFFDGYMAEVCLIDGQQLDPTSFGEFDEDTGIWKPIDVSGLTFGTNGFYLDFENSGSLGADVSGNGNNFTVNNLTSIDQTTDTPTNNFCTLNPLITPATMTFTNGNLGLSGYTAFTSAYGTFGLSSGKWYWELIAQDNAMAGVSATLNGSQYPGQASDSYAFDFINGDKYNNNTVATFGSGAVSIGDTVGVAFDADNGDLKFYNNSGSLIGTAYTGLTSFPYLPVFRNGDSVNISINFGNPPYTESGGNSDANGYGNFKHSVPSGYYALNTKNLAEYG